MANINLNARKRLSLKRRIKIQDLKKDLQETSTEFSNDNVIHRRRQHILIICTDLADKNKSKHIVDTALALKGFGHKITIVTCSHIKSVYEDNLSQIQIIEVGSWIPKKFYGFLVPFFYIFRSFYATIWMTLYLKKISPKPSIVFCEANYSVIPILKTFTDYKVIYFQYKFDVSKQHLPSSEVTLRKNFFMKQSLLNADDILVPNKQFCSIFKRSFGGVKISPIICEPYINVNPLRKEKIVPINHIIDSMNEDCYVFLVLGEYHKRSNFELAIEAFFLLLHSVKHDLHRRMRLVISGHCGKRNSQHREYYRFLTKRVKEMSLIGHVSFNRRFSRGYKKTLMMHSVALIDPVVDEIFNRYILEAMSLGRPVIATDTGFAKEALVHGVTGYVVPPTAEHFSAAMTEILFNADKGEFVGKMAHSEFIKTYSLEAYGARLTKLLDKHNREECL